MIIPISASTKQHLLALPETGMGFQIIDRGDDVREARFVLIENATRARVAWNVEQERPQIRLSQKSSFSYSTEDRLQESINRIEFSTLSHSQAGRFGLVQLSARDGGLPAASSAAEFSIPNERFLRFSAFADDLRILPDGGLRSGTYATTYKDGMTFVKTGMDAVRRYALPSNTPATHRFYLMTVTKVVVQRGTVAPANDQPGGGVEVIFTIGAPAGTKRDYDNVLPAGK